MVALPGGRTRRLIAVVVALFAAAAVVAYLGTRGGELLTTSGGSTEPSSSPTAAVVLPHEEPLAPPGPHRRVFETSCTICHSTRLVFNQPPLSEKHWTAVVDKMVGSYGAPLNQEQRNQVIEYLTAVGGDPKQVAAK
jgi:cytochrome c5